MALFQNLRDLLGMKTSSEPVPPKGHCLCMVVSEQEGAEIWVDGIKTNYVTPKLVAIPKDKAVRIQVRLIGHEDHHASVRSAHNLTYYYCNLTRIPLKLIPGGMANHENSASAYL